MSQGPLVQMGEGMIILPTAYFGPISYYAAMYHADEVVIEACEHYVKQTLRNRCIIATDQGPLTLSCYVEKGNRLKMPIREVRISDHKDWRREHLHALATYYGMSPFYEYYADELREVLMTGHDGTLFDMNEALRRWCCQQIGFEPKVRYSEAYMGATETFGRASAQGTATVVEPFSALLQDAGAVTYYQIASAYGKQPFMADMSILDLLFNMGPEAILVLEKLKS